MASVEHRIFHVAEMLEAMLHQVPQQDLLLSKAVCKLWKQTVEKSHKLQEKLHLTADGDGWFVVHDGA